MQLTVWTYEGPPHIGALRIANSMKGLHYVLHAPQGDTYADLLFTMIERNSSRPPVTYTTFQAQDLGGDTAELFKSSVQAAYDRFQPEAMIVGASCTAELIQDDPGGLAKALGLPCPVVPLDLPAYQKKENWGAAETFYRLVRTFAQKDGLQNNSLEESTPDKKKDHSDKNQKKTCNILGPTSLGFRHRDDVTEIRNLLSKIDIDVNVVAPLGARPSDLTKIAQADFNIVLYPEIALTAAQWLKRTFGQPFVKTTPIGVLGTKAFLEEISQISGYDLSDFIGKDHARLPWYSRSIDSTYLTGKRVFIFGDATHALAAARVAQAELGFKVVGLGTYSREFAREIREAAALYGIEALITDDYLEVEQSVREAQPELVLGTQMERHIAKRLGIPCAVISSPVHVQDFPARYSPQMGFEGANVLFDTWVHPLMMGLEEHLLQMFREDFEFHDRAGPSHLGKASMTSDSTTVTAHSSMGEAASPAHNKEEEENLWTSEAEKELSKIPFFVRGKARRNTERFASEHGINRITLETLYDAKAHYSR
ncbi:MAG: ferredoxin:protochlorophyllide reductase (ATP-dependent) subunit B [Hyphomicrobium sp.]